MKGLLIVALTVCLIASVEIVSAESTLSLSGSPTGQSQPPTQERTQADPSQMVRTLHLMQDQIASGSTEAHVAQRGFLVVLDDEFMKLEPETWQHSKNARAAVTFVLSGGKPQILRKILRLGSAAVSENDVPLIEGALAYVEGREEEARRVLLPINPVSLPISLSAQIALVQSALLLKTDLPKSDELLDFVRLQVPGTLLEEAALRRQVFVASQLGNQKKFERLVTQYLRRYRHSVYAGNFRQRLASVITRIDFGKDATRFEGVVAMMAELEPEARRDLYLLSALASIEQGYTKSALLMAGKAQELSGQDKVSSTRARLYQAAAMIVSPDTIEAALNDLRSLDRALLTANDVALLDAALAIADQIRNMPEQPSSSALKQAPSAPSNQSPAIMQASEQLPALSKARDAIGRVDKLIKN